MKTATVRELRNHYSGLLQWIEAGEEIRITRNGKPIARLVPEPVDSKSDKVDWSQSWAFGVKRNEAERLSAARARAIVQESSGKW